MGTGMALLSPQADCVIIDPEPPPDYHTYRGYEQRAGLIVPDKYLHGPEDRSVWGKVLAKGSGCKLAALQVGARVVFGKYAGARITYEEKPVIIVREGEILAVDEP